MRLFLCHRGGLGLHYSARPPLGLNSNIKYYFTLLRSRLAGFSAECCLLIDLVWFFLGSVSWGNYLSLESSMGVDNFPIYLWWVSESSASLESCVANLCQFVPIQKNVGQQVFSGCVPSVPLFFFF